MNERNGVLAPFYDFFHSRNFENSRRFSGDEYTPENLKNLLESFGNPQYNYKTIHVAGTTAKGSIATYLARSLGKFKTGLFVSPHLESLYERISINGKNITEEDFLNTWEQIKSSGYADSLSFFDALTAISMIYFKNQNVDWAVFETGLGGRQDSTNNIIPEFSVITEIGLDHMNILGSSIIEIAIEKGGIIKQGVPVYSSATDEIARNTLSICAARLNTKINFYSRIPGHNFKSDNQFFVKWIYEDFFKDTCPQISTEIKGRIEEIKSSPRIIFDSAHNYISIEKLIEWINRESEESWNIYLNTMKERSIMEFFELFHGQCKKKIRVFLFPVNYENYYKWGDIENKKLCENLSINQIIELLKDDKVSHLISGSMRLYANLKQIL
jgi:dihydrofolate synthase/folylpolyglutamate synthase